MDDRPIGVFDSGVGGLTVLRALHEQLPGESTVYLGDTARLPYGTKSPEVVTRYALGAGRFLAERGIKALVVACNTASAFSLPALEKALDVPVLGVVEPGARAAVAAPRNRGRIGVIGTPGTIKSGAYQSALARLAPELQVEARACPLFVPLAEEGWTEGEVARLVAREYLTHLAETGVDSLVLGCTHYPLLKSVIAEVMGDGTRLVDSAEATAGAVHDLFASRDLLGSSRAAPEHAYFVTDLPDRFAAVGSRFLGRPIEGAELVDIAPA